MRSLFGNLHTPSGFSPLSDQPLPSTSRWVASAWAMLCVLAGWLQAAALAWPIKAWRLPGLEQGQPSGSLQIVSLTLLVLALQHATRRSTAVWRGWLFATAWLGGTFWWLFVSLHTYGGLPAVLAAAAVLALAGALALYYAAAAGAMHAWAPKHWPGQAVLFAAAWTLAELARAQWFTGFPWGAGGYAHTDLMAGWAPLIGVYGMGAIAAFLAFALATGLGALLANLGYGVARAPGEGHGRKSWLVWSMGALVTLGLLASLVAGHGDALRGGGLAWGQPHTQSTGELKVWLLQGNIAQDEKFVTGTGIAQAMTWYPQQIVEAVRAAKADAQKGPALVVAPETALPMLPQQIGGEFWRPLLGELAAGPVGVLVGLPLGTYEQGYTNSAWGMEPAAAASALSALEASGSGPVDEGQSFHRYDKHHLVPFGEFIPPFFKWFIRLMNIPLGDFKRGELAQPTWAWAGQRIAPNICYEDLFGEELAAGFRGPSQAPTVLINLSNIGWFGDTIAIDQHLQISRLRARELERPMLRATNTGATAVIDHHGVVTHQLPRLTRDRLQATVEGRDGLTPFAVWSGRWGLKPVWALALLVVAVAAGVHATSGRSRRRG